MLLFQATPSVLAHAQRQDRPRLAPGSLPQQSGLCTRHFPARTSCREPPALVPVAQTPLPQGRVCGRRPASICHPVTVVSNPPRAEMGARAGVPSPRLLAGQGASGCLCKERRPLPNPQSAGLDPALWRRPPPKSILCGRGRRLSLATFYLMGDGGKGELLSRRGDGWEPLTKVPAPSLPQRGGGKTTLSLGVPGIPGPRAVREAHTWWLGWWV